MPVGIYRIATTGAYVGTGVAHSIHLTVDAVGKSNVANAPYCIANEMICAELGRFLRLPVPPGGIVKSTYQPEMYASLNFNLTGISLPPVDAATCFRLLPNLSTGLLLFDILIANSDRHAGNLSFDAIASPAEMNVFDHSHALLGYQAGQGAARLTAMTDRLAVSGGPLTRGNRHFLLDVVNSDKYFQGWISRISVLPDFVIDEICADAAPFGMNATDLTAVQTFLRHRRDTFSDVIRAHRLDFTAISTWSTV